MTHDPFLDDPFLDEEPATPGAGPAYLTGLNPQQRAAVEALDGPVLVLAGAGTGKTRVLTTRLAHLLMEKRVFPSRILAVTFTNRAAQEMKERVSRLIGGPVEGWWLGTFHSLAARILRRHAEIVGLTPTFTILDTDDQLRLIKQLLEAANVDTKRTPARMVLSTIDRWKDRGLTPEQAQSAQADDPIGRLCGKIYAAYQARLRTLNACDFGDLLLHNLALFQHRETDETGTARHPILEEWQDRFRYILVDEYQDTNVAQYLWLRALAAKSRNLCVVGDEDQCLVAGTPIALPDGRERPIETIEAGQSVLTALGGGLFGPSTVARVHKRRHNGRLIRIVLEDGRIIESTPEHRHFAGYRLGTAPDQNIVYLMLKRGVGFRLGTSQTYTKGQASPVHGFEQRCRQEHADALWVLENCPTPREARLRETLICLESGIPTLPFVARKSAAQESVVGDQGLIDRVFQSRPTLAAGRDLLTQYGLDMAYPHYRPQAHTGRRRNVTVTLCGEKRTSGPLHRISVITSDADDAASLRDLGLSIRPVKKGHAGFRYETAMADLGAVMAIVERISAVFEGDVALVQYGRFGAGVGEAIAANDDADRSGDGAEAAPVRRTRSSLPMLPAASLRPGMVMFDRAGGLVRVAEVTTGERATTVYDLDIDRTHNFIANGVVTHNSVYGWRGAEIGNILRFEEDFPGAKVIRLEENYRSTDHILGAASGLIANNASRLGKTLFTRAEGGELVEVRALWDGEEEARFIVDEIEALIAGRGGRDKVSPAEIAMLVRTSAQMRELEDRLITVGVPYRVVGGPRFYERREIRDAMAYFRLIQSPADDLAFERIVNVPKRGLGPKAIQAIRKAAEDPETGEVLPLMEGVRRAVDGLGGAGGELPTRARSTLKSLFLDFERWRRQAAQIDHTDLAGIVLDESGYMAMWQAEKSPDAQGRVENLQELINAMAEFDTLASFLEHVSLVMEANDDRSADKVVLMTLHGAKGLEFSHVFLPGWEEGLFPNQRAVDENGIAGLEEERRLAYVGLTRARKRAIVSHAANRRLFGNWMSAIPSRFVEEIPADHRRVENEMGTGLGATAEPPPTMLWDASKSPPRPRAPVLEGRAYEVAAPPRPKRAYTVGERVFHRKFGYGAVTAVDNDKLSIHFETSGDKKVLDNYVVPADEAE